MSVFKWGSIPGYECKYPYIFSRFEDASMSFHLRNLHHLKLVRHKSTHVTCLHCSGPLQLIPQEFGMCWYLVWIICVWCWCLYFKVWYTCTLLGPSKGFSFWTWWHTMFHQVLDGFQQLVETTVVEISVKLGLLAHSWPCGWLWSVSELRNLKYSI